MAEEIPHIGADGCVPPNLLLAGAGKTLCRVGTEWSDLHGPGTHGAHTWLRIDLKRDAHELQPL